MSNALAVATVTETLRQTLEASITNDISGAVATAVRPVANGGTGGPPKLGINVFLYQVSPNAAWRNRDLPTRNGNAEVVNRPRVAVDLHYLVTFYGDEKKLEPQRLLGRVVQRLHSQSVLTRKMVENAIQAQPFLAASNLAKDVELVKFTPLPLSLEELSKLWSVFFQTQYALSVAYQGTVVLIEADETPMKALPVQERLLYVAPFRQPVITKVAASAGENEPILAGGTLVITGEQLRGEITRLRLGSAQATPKDGDVGDGRIIVPVPATLTAGVQGAQVIQPKMMGKPPVEHRGVESNVFPFVLQPSITGITATSSVVKMSVSPAVTNTQRVVLLLNQHVAVSPAVYAFAPDTDKIQILGANLEIPITGVIPGDYFVRLQVDGAGSAVQLDPGQPNFGPLVTIP